MHGGRRTFQRKDLVRVYNRPNANTAAFLRDDANHFPAAPNGDGPGADRTGR